MTTHSRAKAGGEIGANGEFYKGGAFINTVPENPKGNKISKKATRKQNVYFNQWEVAPSPELRALWPMLSGSEIPNRDVANWQFTFNPELRGDLATAEYIEIRKARIAKFNAGERWV